MFIVNRIIWILNILAGLALLFSYLSPFVNPAHIWMLAFFGLAYPVLLALNLLFIVYWLITGKLKLIFSLVCVLVGYSHLPKLFKLNGQEKLKEENDIVLVSMNVSNFGQRNGSLFVDTFSQYIQEIEADILCLQEFVETKKKEKHLARINRVSKRKYYLIQGKQPGAVIGPAIFSRFKPIESGYLSFGTGATNGVVWADVVLPGKDTVRIYSCHFQSNRLGAAEQITTEDVQNQEVAKRKTKNLIRRLKNGYERRSKQVALVEEHLMECPYPVIIAGDFNDTQLSYTYRRMSKNRIDAFVESGEGLGNTYVGPFPSYRIDYILFDPHFQSYNYRNGPRFESDHKLIQVLLKSGS